MLNTDKNLNLDLVKAKTEENLIRRRLKKEIENKCKLFYFENLMLQDRCGCCYLLLVLTKRTKTRCCRTTLDIELNLIDE